ncbi:colanic acid biosynthesis glycosyltransferase WcaL [Xaviernesmea oryzae]|uniref:Colanic acid biosynthesis glycosyltransferase WcaL n=1 Tax=Xaviernesmea oryzae TaxID=464029 RepID=A0A1Q9B319_9HYPH|nr:glycosyltransferase [Xaviernesmea oryzae]OLP62382.1 colanic acid biosynthesis glycosyltransferase WcaL [Xaviernesmea oryzae]SEL98865.1 Glycosyltransferase involved in cell wall bisynthesis [Xaviernesmea oryzae]
MHPPLIVVVLKGYPRLSETFIAQELLGLEKAGLQLSLISMRRPTDARRHPVHDEIRAPVLYLPEYLHEEPVRVAKAWWKARRLPGYKAALKAFLRDLPRDVSRNRLRRFGQACVLSAEWPEGGAWLHAHFIHTPAAVARYTALMTGTPFTCSAHAKDIWTSPDWELADKLAESRWTVTCTKTGHDHLQSLAAEPQRVHLSYHGLDLDRFGPFQGQRTLKDGSNAADPVIIASVGRAVPKKGYDILLKALAALPADIHWRFEHVGGGTETKRLKALAESLGLSERITWHGALAQEEVLALYRRADLFALACRITPDGDRDGLPNVIVEASSQRLPVVATDISGVPELLTDGQNGYLTPSENPDAFAEALIRAIRDPHRRAHFGLAAEARVRSAFDYHASIRQLKTLFETEWQTHP